jgi:hypothetical protein
MASQRFSHIKIQWLLFSPLIGVAIIYLFHGFSNLLSHPTSILPTDLALRYHQANDLIIDKINVYQQTAHAQYPPSTFLFLSPLTHFSPYELMDEWWAILHILSLFLSVLLLNKLFPQKEKTYLIIASLLAFHSIPHAMGVGQISVIMTGFLMGSLYFLKFKSGILYKALGIILLTFALGKYSLMIPIALVLLIDEELQIPTLLSIGVNIVLSYLVLLRVDSSIPEYIQLLLSNSSETQQLGTIDIQAIAGLLNAPDLFNLIGPLIIIAAFTIIIITYRKKLTLWDQLAIASIVARFFIYHNHYDNIILIFVMVALLKKYTLSKDFIKNREFVLFLLTVFSLIIPARFLIWDAPFYGFFLIFQLTLWIGLSIYLINYRLNETTS